MSSATQFSRLAMLLLAGSLSQWIASGQALADEKRQALHVANNGVDSDRCGTRQAPCRSITRAIALANEGDLVLVGPGRYGDLNLDGMLDGPGEEAGQPDFGCQCVVDVNKPRLIVWSTHGAAATVVDASLGAPEDSPAVAVRITADAVTFGRAGRGFTLTRSGLNVGLSVANVTDVTVAGNISSANAGGFGLFGSGNVLTNNVAVGINGAGFDINGRGHLVSQNASLRNGNGFLVFGMGHVLVENLAIGEGTVGFTLFGDAELIGNSALGNVNAGVHLRPGAFATLRRNNLFGNGGQVGDPPLATRTNCGILNQSGREIGATQNFWGAQAGPGEDPADEVCDAEGSRTIVEPFAARAFRIPKAEEIF